MKITSVNYEAFIDNYFKVLPHTINVKHEALTTEDFNLVMHSSEAKQAKNVVYLWQTEHPIPRVQGSSHIIYIGQTKRSIYRRHGNSNVKATSLANKQKYNAIVKQYGAISISYIEMDVLHEAALLSSLDLVSMEGQLLWWYFRNHSEYPPINYTKTKVRNEMLDFDRLDRGMQNFD